MEYLNLRGRTTHFFLFLYSFLLMIQIYAICGCQDYILNKFGGFIFVNKTQPGPVNCSWIFYRQKGYTILEVKLREFIALGNVSSLDLHEGLTVLSSTIYHLDGNYTQTGKEAVYSTLGDGFNLLLNAPDGYRNLSISYLSYNEALTDGSCPKQPGVQDFKCHTINVCIQNNLTCDGFPQCQDNTDETYACGLAHEGIYSPIISSGLIAAIFFLVVGVIALFVYLSIHYFWKMRLFQREGLDTIRMTQSSADMGKGPERRTAKSTAEEQIHDPNQQLDYGTNYREYQPHHRPSHQAHDDPTFDDSAYTVYI
ncbi:uncharacterized protein LOC135493471 [Lineus longissimus]|uniref:uncharacterized protein LOC135493471 n=1 Tax=Lineus longissimus TaxID=88925 RepID=UPI002B4CEA6E